MRETKKPITFTFEPNCYPIRFAVWIGAWDKAKVLPWLEQIGAVNDDDTIQPPDNANAMATYDFGSVTLIWMPKRPKTVSDFALLTHEAVHAAMAAGRYLGLKPSEESEEFYTYMTQYIVTKVVRRLA